MTSGTSRGDPERVADLSAAFVDNPSRVRVGDPLSRAIELLLARPESRAVYVEDAAGKLVGVVSFRSLLRATKARYGVAGTGLFSFVTYFRDLLPERVEQVMRPATPVRAVTPLRDAFLLLEETKQNDLPVVDDEGKLVGELNGMHVMRLALDLFARTESDLARSRERAAKE